MAIISLKVKPFDVPTEVILDLPGTGRREDGMQALPKLKLNQIDAATLEALISEWAEAVMAAAAVK